MTGYRPPLDLNGDYTGYNNGPSMKVGLWICNDGALIGHARDVARQRGPDGLREYLSNVIRAQPSQPQTVRYTLSDYDLDELVDWPQVAYALLVNQDDDASRAAVARLLAEREAEAQS